MVVEVEAAGVPALEAAMGLEAPLVALRRARGCRCFAACAGGSVVAYGWLSTGPERIGEAGLELRPAPGEAYVWNCLTLPEHRRQGWFRALLLAVVARARAEGLARLWIASAGGGAESAVRHAGFVPVLEVSGLELAGRWWLRPGTAAGVDPELARAGRERLGLQGRTAVRSARRRTH